MQDLGIANSSSQTGHMALPHHTGFRILGTLSVGDFQITFAQFTCKTVFCLDFITSSSVTACLNLKAKLLFSSQLMHFPVEMRSLVA